MSIRSFRRTPGPRRPMVRIPVRRVRRWHVNLGVLCGAVGALVIIAAVIYGVVKIVEVIG